MTMTEDTDQPQDNVVSLDEAREAKQENPWRITAVRYKEGTVLLKGPDGKQYGTNAFILNIQFLDRAESKVVVANQGHKGYKDINIPIPIGLPAEQFYEILRQIPEQIQAHLEWRAPDPEGAA